jgi:beta-barrel assembly-enhancing protease
VGEERAGSWGGVVRLSSSVRFALHFHGKTARWFLFPLLVLSLATIVSAGGPSANSPGPIFPHSGPDFQVLMDIDQQPQPVAPQLAPVRAGGKPVKIDPKYDVNKIGERGTGSGINFYSVEQEQALGKELSQEVEAHCKLLKDQPINNYVNTLGQRLVRYSDAKVPFTIRVLDDDQVNAFALPGGFLYVTTGLILAAETEAELAGVMSHEIAHVAARHGTKGATRTQIWNLASIPLIFVGGPVGLAVRQVSQIAMPMTLMKFSRNFEREADTLGLEYEYAAGYDPEAFVDFFERMNSDRKKPNFMARAFATHPMNKDRIERAQKEIDTMLPEHDQYVVTTSEFVEVRSHLQELKGQKPKLGTDQHNGNKPVLHRREPEGPVLTDDNGPKLQPR